MHTFLTLIHVFVAVFLILVVLLQTGKGGMGAALGGASSSGVFGARGAGNFLTRTTAVCATIFMLTSMSLSIISSKSGSVVEGHGKSAPTAPAAPSGDAAPSTTPPAEESATEQTPPQGATPPAAKDAPAKNPSPAPAAPSKPKK